MSFVKYNKIEALHKEDVEGILVGTCNVTEKLDGANTSLWLEDGIIRSGSRNTDITEQSFRGFNDYIRSHEGILAMLEDNPNYHVYGEWLVKHTIQYNEVAYQKWYMFDIMDKETMTPFRFNEVEAIAKKYGILTPFNYGSIENPTKEDLMVMVGESKLGDKGEGIVIRNYEFVNKFGRRPYAKIVGEKFKETNALVFGGNNKHADAYWEQYIVNKYVTLARVKKMMEKVSDAVEDRKIDERETSQMCSRILNDIITEECWEIFKKVPIVNNKVLKTLISKKVAKMFKDILHGFESVAYEGKEDKSEATSATGADEVTTGELKDDLR